jgi:hypothetical protein
VIAVPATVEIMGFGELIIKERVAGTADQDMTVGDNTIPGRKSRNSKVGVLDE